MIGLFYAFSDNLKNDLCQIGKQRNGKRKDKRKTRTASLEAKLFSEPLKFTDPQFYRFSRCHTLKLSQFV